MKKVLTALVLLLCCLLSFTGCSLLFGPGYPSGSNNSDNGSSGNAPSSSVVTIYFGSSSTKYTIKDNDYAEIHILATNDGTMIEGIYDSQSGGTKYFDLSTDGTYFTNLNPWNSYYPQTFYAQYTNSATSYTSSVINYEDPASSIKGTYALDRNLIKTIINNPSSTVNFQFTFQVLDASWGVWSYVAESTFYVGTKSKKEKIASGKYSNAPSSWETKTENGTASGQLILNRECSLYIVLSSSNGVGYDMAKFKNLQYAATITF